MMASALEEEGYGVESTTNPTEALELVCARRYALVVSDVNMPGMPETVLAAEAVKLQPGLHTLLVTALADRRLRAEAEALGALLLIKPVRLEVLSAAVREVLGGRAAKRVGL
jgi:DNA-binding NtrC family response regulator